MKPSRLRGTLIARGVRLKDLADALGISVSTMYRKTAAGDFKVREALVIAEKLELSDQEAIEIFFNRKVSDMRRKEENIENRDLERI